VERAEDLGEAREFLAVGRLGGVPADRHGKEHDEDAAMPHVKARRIAASVEGASS
jgi:hypothetical protein